MRGAGIILGRAHPHRLSWVLTRLLAAWLKLVHSTGDHVQESPTLDFWRRTITITLRFNTSLYIRNIKSNFNMGIVFVFRIFNSCSFSHQKLSKRRSLCVITQLGDGHICRWTWSIGLRSGQSVNLSSISVHCNLGLILKHCLL